MANENEVHTKIREYLTNGDTHGCTVYLEELMRRTTRREIRFYGIYFPIKHPVFGELSALEWAVLYNVEDLFKIVRNYGQMNNPVLYNFYDVDLDYLATLSGFKLALPRTTPSYRGQPKYLQREPNSVTIATRLGHTRILENISNIKTHKESDWTSETSETQRKPLDIAALHNRVEVCRLLLQNQFVQAHAPKLIDLSDYGNALHIAARFGHVAIIHELLDPSNIKTTFWKHTEVLDKLKYTALGLAVLHVHADAVKELVIRGKADVNAAQGLNGLTPLQLILSDDCKYREEFFAVDKFSRDKIIRVLLDAGANQEGLTKEQLAYINELVEREASREHDIDSSEPMVEEEPILSLKTSSDDAVKPPEHASPNKKEPLECLLCDKKFTSAISLQAHLKSKGHVKQERKERLQKRGQPVSIEELDAHERKRIGLIERLPLLSELINLILIKLNKLDLLRFAATSKSIQMLVCKQKLLWNELEVSITWPMWERNEKKLSFFSDIANRLPTLEKFTVKSCNASDEVYNSIFEIPRLCTSLKELDIQRIYRDYPVSWLGGVFQKNTQLTSLKVHRIIPWKRAKVQAVKDGELNPEQPEPAPANPKKPWKKKRVKQVKKPDPRKWMVDLDSVMHSGSTSLQHLTIDVGFPEDVQHDLIVDLTVGIFKRCPNLTSIQLCHTWDNENVTSITLKKLLYGLFDACPKLKRVKLEGEWLFGRLSNDEYDALFKRFGAFESFKLEGDEISNFDRDIHDFIGDYCQNLKALRILHLNAVAFNGPHFGLSSCTNLTELFISKSGEMNEGGDQFLHTITSRCTKIAKLILDIKPVTNAIVQGMAQLGTTLRVLKSKDQQRDHVVNYTPLVRCVNLVKLELQRVTISDAYTIIEHCKHIRDLDLYMVSDEDNPVIQQQLQQQQNNDNQAQDNNNNQAPNNNNNAQQPDDNNNAAPANNNAQNPVANNQEGAQQQQQANNNNNNNPAPPPPVIHKEVDFGLILEKCADLTDMYLYAPMSCDSFSRMVVHTGLTKIRNLSSSSAGLKSDWPIFYLAECCPNLKHLAVDYGFTLTDACEPTFVRRFPKLEVLVGSSSRYCDFFKRVNEQRVNSFFYDY